MINRTKELFYLDSYETVFQAKVLSCEETKTGFAIVLDQTLFYPEGGGQAADIGYLNKAQVLDVHEKDGVIVHSTDKPLSVDEIIEGQIDWSHRFPLMQKHTGEHIVSGIINRLFGYDNVGFHMGTDTTTDINGELSADDLRLVEKLVNEAIQKDIKTRVYSITEDTPNPPSYRSKKKIEGSVRIVSISDVDSCACCGLHCAYTGEVGIVKILTAQKYKGGMRIYLLCGSDAVEDYANKNCDVYEISSLLSAKPNEVSEAVKKLLDEKAAIKQELIQCKKEIFQHRAEKIPLNTGKVCLFEKDLQPSDLQRYCTLLCDRAEIAAVFSAGEENVYKYVVGSKATDVREIGKKLNTTLNGRGGGKAEMVQGTVYATKTEIESLFASF